MVIIALYLKEFETPPVTRQRREIILLVGARADGPSGA